MEVVLQLDSKQNKGLGCILPSLALQSFLRQPYYPVFHLPEEVGEEDDDGDDEVSVD